MQYEEIINLLEKYIKILQKKYKNRIFSYSDIKQECLLKLWKTFNTINFSKSTEEIISFAYISMKNHLIDTTTKFISPEGKSRKIHKKKITNYYQNLSFIRQKGFNIDENEFNLCFFNELSFYCTRKEINFIKDCIFGVEKINKKYNKTIKNNAINNITKSIEKAIQ